MPVTDNPQAQPELDSAAYQVAELIFTQDVEIDMAEVQFLTDGLYQIKVSRRGDPTIYEAVISRDDVEM